MFTDEIPTPTDLADHPPAAPRPQAAPVPPPTQTGKARWPIFGIVGGASAFAAVSLAMAANVVTKEESLSGVELVKLLDGGAYHRGFLAGLLSVGTLLVASSGWKRWAERRAPGDLAARTIGQGLALTATVALIFHCFMGALAIYLPGGSDHGWQPDEQLYVTWSMLDFGSLVAWWGAAASAACVAVLALRKQAILPRWMGITSIVLLLPGLLMAITTGLPGFMGFTMPIWLVVISTGMVFSEKANAAA